MQEIELKRGEAMPIVRGQHVVAKPELPGKPRRRIERHIPPLLPEIPRQRPAPAQDDTPGQTMPLIPSGPTRPDPIVMPDPK